MLQGINPEDDNVINTIIESWNKKLFRSIIKDKKTNNYYFGTKLDSSLKEFMLKIFSTSQGDLSRLFNEPDLDYLSAVITSEVWQALKIAEGLSTDATEDLFDNCTISG